MIMLSGDKQRLMDSIVESITSGKKEYSTEDKFKGEAAKLAAMELINAIEQKSPDAVVAAFEALMIECEVKEEEMEY